MKRNVRVN